MFKNIVAYWMFIMLGLSSMLSAQPFNKAQEKAFAEATIALLEWITFIDRDFSDEIIVGLEEQLTEVQEAFRSVEQAAGNLPTRRRVRFEPYTFNGSELLDQANTRLMRIARLIRTYRFGPAILEQRFESERQRIEIEEEDDFLREDRIQYLRDTLTDTRSNLPGNMIERIRDELRALLGDFQPVLRHVFDIRNQIIVRGVDEEGLYEDRLNFDARDLADAFFNQVRTNYIPTRQENGEGVNVRSAVNRVLRDLDEWLGITEQEAIDSQVIRSHNFNDFQQEAFAQAFVRLTEWVNGFQGGLDLEDQQNDLAALREIRLAFQYVGGTNPESTYDHLFDDIDESDQGAARVDLNQTLQTIDTRLAEVESRLQHLQNGSGGGPIMFEFLVREIRRELFVLFNDMRPVAAEVYGIEMRTMLGGAFLLEDLVDRLNGWLERFEEENPVNIPSPTQPLTYRGNINPRDLFEGNVPQVPQYIMHAGAEPYYPTHQQEVDPYRAPSESYYPVEQLDTIQEYPPQIYTTEHIQLQPGVQPRPYRSQYINPHVVVQPPQHYGPPMMMPGYGVYPQQQYMNPQVVVVQPQQQPCYQQQQGGGASTSDGRSYIPPGGLRIMTYRGGSFPL